MANIVRRAAYTLMEKTMATHAKVLDIRIWNPATMYEIDLYLPNVDMRKWQSIHRLKCKVDEFEYRDYTPAWWEAEKGICTLFIETGHKGAGSRWAQRIQLGDWIVVGPAHAAPVPVRPGKVLCLVDGSALGHVFGLKQLTDYVEQPLEVGVFFQENYQIPTTLSSENPEFEFILNPQGSSLDSLAQWSLSKDVSEYSSIYVAGYIPMVRELRKRLKIRLNRDAKIYAHGFWQ